LWTVDAFLYLPGTTEEEIAQAKGTVEKVLYGVRFKKMRFRRDPAVGGMAVRF
jgi:hypothetical protein